MGTLVGKITEVPIKDLTFPKNGCYDIRLDWWWIVKNESLLFYCQTSMSFGSPQCNADRRLAESVRDRIYPEAEVRQIPAVYIPHRS